MGENTEKNKSLEEHSEIAIVGMACRFPESDNYQEFWNHLVNGDNLIREIDEKRWDVKEYYSPEGESGKSISKWCGIVERMEYFDNQFFQISPREALVMDPHQRQLLEVSWQCIEDAGISLKRLQEGKTGVYMNVSHSDYGLRTYAVAKDIDSYTNLGNYPCVSANRISFAFGLTGPSLSMEAACAASLVTVNEARRVLLTGECDSILVGSGNFILHHGRYISFSKARMLSKSGQCKTFDKDADGYVPGEGVGVLLLKRLEDAIRDKNHIHAVIKASKAGHIGHHVSITAPKVKEQKNMILAAYEEAGISPETVSYVEAHGTGTSLGDPIEVEALTRVFREYTDLNQYCKIGSVKTNIGHLEGTSGLAGLIKTVLMMKYHKIPKTLNIKTLNPMIDFTNSPFIAADELSEWRPSNERMPLRGGISSYGFGGAGCHILLEEYRENREKAESCPINIFLLSAKSLKSLDMLVNNFRKYVTTREFKDANLSDILGTALLSRSQFKCRYGFKTENKQDFVDKLTRISAGSSDRNYDRWFLNLKDLKLVGYRNFEKLYHTQPIFSAFLDEFKPYVEEEVWKSLFEAEWMETYKRLYTFMVYEAFVRTLREVGIKIHAVAYQGNGFLTSLSIGGILTVKEIVDYIMGNADSHSLKFTRPNINVQDTVSGQKILPYKILDEKFKKIIQDIHMEDDEFYDYLAKARILYKSVASFRKLLEEWNIALEQISRTAKELIFTEPSRFRKQKEQFLTVIMISSSKNKLNKKWDLKEEKHACLHRLTELLYLVDYNLIPKEEIVRIFSLDQPDYEMIARNISKKLLSSTEQHNIKSIGVNELTEISDLDQWLKLGGKAESREGSEMMDMDGSISIDQDGLEKVAGQLGELLMEVVLESWLQGADIEWNKMVLEESFYKIALPVYEFEKNSYLLPIRKDNNYIEIKPAERKKPDEKYEEPEHKVSYQREAYGGQEEAIQDELQNIEYVTEKDTIIKDHVITGKKLIPGAFMIEIIVNSLKKTGLPVLTLKQLTFMKPGIVSKDLKLSYSVDKDVFTILEEKAVLCKGKYASNESVLRVPVHISAVHSYPKEDLSGLYMFFNSMGYQYGESLQVIQNIWKINNGYIIGLQEKEYRKERNISAELLDGVIQSVLAVLYLEGDLQLEERIYIPYQLQELILMEELNDICYAAIDKKNIIKQTGSIIAGLEVFNKEGLPVLSIKGLCLKACPKDFLHMVEDEKDKELFHFKPVWVKANTDTQVSFQRKREVFIFSNERDNKAVKQYLEKIYDKIYFVYKGITYATGENSYDLDPTSLQDYFKLFDSIERKGTEYDIFYLWMNQITGARNRLENVETTEMKQLQAVFYLLQTLIKRRDRGIRELIIGVTDSRIIEESDTGCNYFYGGLEGLIRTVKQESNRLSVSILDFWPGDRKEADFLTTMVFESGQRKKELIAAYRNNCRYVRGIVPQPVKDGIDKSLLADGDTYLIIGGLGGIGSGVAEEIGRLVKANLIIIGTASLNEDRRERLKSINLHKSSAEYYPCDITNQREMNDLLEVIKKKYKSIQGVIHCGGRNQDRLLQGKAWTEFLMVLKPKILGTYLLNEVTKNEPLKFFVSFSSIASITGNVGQADYAYANGVLDAFMDYRRNNDYPGKSICINWSLWEHVGMGSAGAAIRNFADKTGLITLGAGKKDFINILQNESEEIIVVEDADKFKRYLSKCEINYCE
ncbi:hypothetical protein acsn021_15530 [Anaerocolumna cellulosilytica]|uniref:Uncharacterized protein n=1 Tax=Anaerocolumna cellulosilytica TaxID=433286 RepID=A0A6S6QTN0_9FIRM|nr:SDR family NAD(P)-dependent oxidoreductase [Anaerocolumna cellulosilytica]MBB5196722.1 3-oxoacyl-(acyl-carrier-protein) synthase [Anaerocolumna cellulosilytica]BCJ93984.1 hypothetical protein acsn021_15530 [Anaerocolumna cellulosilytica]